MLNRLDAPRSRPLANGTVVEISITDLLGNGQGVGRADGQVVFVWGPLPGERARVRISLVKRNYAVGELLEILERSADRVTPFCPVFGTCGGCQVQHLAYPAQLAWKRSTVENALRRIGGIPNVDVAETIGMEQPRHYRNKMALVVQMVEGGPPQFGFYQARTHDVVPIRACPVVQPALDRTIEQLWDAARSPQTQGAFTGAGHVVARSSAASGDVVVSVTTDRPSTVLPAVAPALLAALPGAVGVANSYEPASANAIMGRKHATLAGEAEIEDEIGGVRFRVSPASFFQINGAIVGAIFEFLQPSVRAGQHIVDLYSGAGTFALFFARHGARVVGIEENASAVREARASAERNGLAQVQFFAGRVEQLVRSGPTLQALKSAGVVFLDPPRKGSDETTLGAIAASRVPQVWYLSCNPATLARDLVPLLAAGYELRGVQPFDMFPQTGHIEALAMLRVAGRA